MKIGTFATVRYSGFGIRNSSFGIRKMSLLPERVKVSISNQNLKFNLKNMLRILYDDFDQKVKNIHDEMDLHRILI